MKHYKIIDITEWDVKRNEIAGVCSHTGDNYNIALGEAEEKIEELKTQGGEGLPFVCEAEDEEDALNKYNEKYYGEEDYQASEAEIVEVRRFVVSLQVDTRIEVEVFAENALEAGRQASDAPFEMKDLEFIESHMVSAYDVENNKLIDLC